MNKDLTTRTPGEELWCRRRRAGLTTSEAAEALGVGRTRLWLAEADVDPLGAHLEARFAPRLRELLALARRRQGWGLRSTARKVGVSHVTLGRMEDRADPRLREAWEGWGFTFVRK